MRTNKIMGDKGNPLDAMFIHYSPPRLVEARRWARGGDVDRLQRAALGGHGGRLLQLRLAAPAARTKAFLGQLPGLVDKCNSLHAAVTEGNLQELKSILEGDPMRKRLALCRDRAGVGLLHKAVYYDFVDIVNYLIDNYPTAIHMRDSEGRTPLHYAAMCGDPSSMSSTLVSAGAERAPQDLHQRTPTYYMNHSSALELPIPSPNTPSNADLVIKPSNIRIWCHDRDLGRLQQVVWKGEGARLRTEVSSQPAVKKFLEAVPHIMGTIKDIHTAVIENDLPKLKTLSEEPIPPIILSSKDTNGMTPLHKACGLGHYEIAKYIANRYPESVTALDNDGRTPLHWSALAKEDERIYNLLLEKGAPEGKLDSKMKSVGFYRNRPATDFDRSLLQIVPEAPRIASPVYPASWDWSLLNVNAPSVSRPKKSIPTPIPEEKFPEEPPSPKREPSPVKKIRNARRTSPEVLKPISPPPNELPIETHEDYSEQLDMEQETISENDLLDADESIDIRTNDGDDDEEDVVPRTAEVIRSATTRSRPSSSTMKAHNHHHHHLHSRGGEREEPLQNDDVSDDMEGAPHVEDEDVDERRNFLRTAVRPSKSTSNDKDDEDVYARGEEESEYGDDHKADTADVLDVEKFKNRRSAARDGARTGSRQSRGSESMIEGVVNADPEVDSLDADQGDPREIFPSFQMNRTVEEDEIQQLIDTCNMEQLAALVLNGDGERLVGQMSTNGELQAFLDNVPTYMNKIKRVHISARSGGLRELQAALDRRKFAIARDHSSPRGATPLHVAVIFGRTPILRYLAARFPETLSAVDFDGRTALHYAAILNDNGHYYNILQNMGANPRDQDDVRSGGHTPEDFLKSDEHLSHRELLKEFGAEDGILDEMLNDKEPDTLATAATATNDNVTTTTAAPNNNGHNGQVDIPIFRTEEGRYLASSLGDPLIKGLTEVANARPKDPIAFLATYLYNFANQNKSRLKTQESAALIGSEQRAEESVQNSNRLHAAPLQVPPTPSVPNTPGGPEAAFSSDNRDEHGQSMIHFAAARSHGRGALLQLVREAEVSPAFRDELYRTARDVSIQANIPENTRELDRWLIEVAAKGEVDKMTELVLEGYDHILDVVDDEGVSVTDVVSQREQVEMTNLLAVIPNFEETRERLHQAIRGGNLETARETLDNMSRGIISGRNMAVAKNAFGRCSLHIAVLAQQDELTEYIARKYPETLRIGDNLERTALHYAMGADNVESTSRILIKAGAKRVLKDLKGRQPSYYFMNKSEILRLKEEEESY